MRKYKGDPIPDLDTMIEALDTEPSLWDNSKQRAIGCAFIMYRQSFWSVISKVKDRHYYYFWSKDQETTYRIREAAGVQ